jgi:hypothetical protein
MEQGEPIREYSVAHYKLKIEKTETIISKSLDKMFKANCQRFHTDKLPPRTTGGKDRATIVPNDKIKPFPEIISLF